MGLLLCACSLIVSAETAERKWFDSTYKHSTVASLVAVNDEAVSLKKQSGETIVVPMKKLCEECRWIVRARDKSGPIRRETERIADEQIERREPLARRLEWLDEQIEELNGQILTPEEELKRQVAKGKRPDPKPEYRPAILKIIAKEIEKRTHERLDPLYTAREETAKEFARGFSVSWFRQDMKVGEVGTFLTDPSQPLRVLQILGPHDMLVSYGAYKLNRFDPNVIILMRGMDTAGLVDDAALPSPLGKIFMVTGTHTYDSVGGSRRTVFVAEPFDLQ